MKKIKSRVLDRIANKYRQLAPSPEPKLKDARIKEDIDSSDNIIFLNARKTLEREKISKYKSIRGLWVTV